MTREELHVKSGIEYDHYFPKALGGSETKKKGATVADTIRFIPQVVHETKWQTKRFANEVIKADTVYQTCKNLWEFVFNHIAYKKDEDGKEQVRSPARTWRDRHNFDEQGNLSGVDCDCYSVFISSILSNLKIKHGLRITKYEEDHFQHIYPIVPMGNGQYITIDCVVKQFNYEEPYTEKKDTTMDLEYLNGVVSDQSLKKNNQYSEDLMGMMDEKEAMMELGKIFKQKSSSSGSSSGSAKKGMFQRKTVEQKQVRKANIKKFINKGLHVTNRLNPATATLRAGILAAMKINFTKIGSELKYTYLTDEQANQRGLDMIRFPKMKRVREKLEKLFYGAGGKPENLKKAILTGRANKDKSIPLNGLGYVPYENIDGLNEDMPLSQLLGRDMYASESMNEVNGLGELGEPATAATIAAATTVLTTIVALIKSVGSLAPKKKSGSSSEGNSNTESHQENNSSDNGSSESASSNQNNSSSSENEEASSENASSSESSTSDNETTNGNTKKSSSSNLPAHTNSSSAQSNTSESDDENENTSAQRTTNSNAKEATTAKDKLSFWEKHKKWIKPTGITIGSLGLIALAYQLFKPKPKPALKGVPEKKEANAYKPKSKKASLQQAQRPKSKKVKSKKKEAVTLL
jgi:hypothetical protein